MKIGDRAMAFFNTEVAKDRYITPTMLLTRFGRQEVERTRERCAVYSCNCGAAKVGQKCAAECVSHRMRALSIDGEP